MKKNCNILIFTILLVGTFLCSHAASTATTTKKPSASARVSTNSAEKSVVVTVSVALKVFLQGAIDSTKNIASMTNYLQAPNNPNISALLPVNNPYAAYPGYGDVQGRYTQINNVSGPAKEVTDWVLVEIWGNVNTSAFPYTYDLVERRAFLLKPNGSVVDTNGLAPQFAPYAQSDVRVVVSHRNHMGVISNNQFAFNAGAVVEYDFTTGPDKAFGSGIQGVPEPMVKSTYTKGAACLWAGDLNFDGNINPSDWGLFNPTLLPISGTYSISDISLDGLINADDYNFIYPNYVKSIYSLLTYFKKSN